MTIPAALAPEPRRFLIRLLLPLWICVAALALLPAGQTVIRILCLVLILLSLGQARSGEPQSGIDARKPDSSLSAAEKELIQLVTAVFEKYDAYYEKAETISDADEQSRFYEQQDPGHTFVPRLLAFEKDHARTHIGLMALRRVVLMAGGGGLANNPCYQGRREALRRLPRYCECPELFEALRHLDRGDFEPGTEAVLRELSAESKGNATTRQFSSLMLARWMLSARDSREYIEQRVRELKNGAEPRYRNEGKNLELRLLNLPKAEQLRAWEQEAGDLLRAIAASKEHLRQPAVKGVDPHWNIIRIDRERTKEMPLISEVADGLLFKESHLKAGKPAPDLNVTLLSGQKWSLAEQRGRAVIIQFSFKGCGPCEAMYPILREIQQTHGNRVSILSIMHDEERADAESAISEGKLTWDVHWDGYRGPVATRWAVVSFPTVYVFDAKGTMAGFDLVGQELKEKIVQLLK